MRPLIIILNLIIIFFVVSCSNSLDDEGKITLKGSLYYKGLPLQDANVIIDEQLNWSTQTDSEGNFEINGITRGEHILRASKRLEGDQVTSIESSVTLTETVTDLGEIRLPIPPHMYEVDTTQVTYESVPLKWNMAPDPEFREYKLYRLDHPGLDETTGDLIFVSTSLNDTTYTDNTILPATRYYYRIYTLSAFGKMGGSNMVNVLAPHKNLVLNPDFEVSSNGVQPDVWKDGVWYRSNINGYVSNILVDSLNVHSGNYSGRIEFNPNHHPGGGGEVEVRQIVSRHEFEVGKDYEISIWMKTGNMRIQCHIGRLGYWWGPFLPENWLEPNQDWTKYSTTFTVYEEHLTEDPWIRLFIDWQTAPPAPALGHAWVDEVKLVKLPD
jgi:hypothetical protein